MKIILTLLGVLVIGISILFCLQDKDKTRYVSMTQVFNESHLKVEYQKSLAEFEEQSKQQLLKLQDEVNASKTLGDVAKQKLMEDQFVSTQERLQEEYQKKSAAFEEIIWKEINQKVTDYGKEHGIDFILGAKGDGTIMYANEEKEITKEIIEYINKKK